VETLICRDLPLETWDGPRNMAADEVLLESAGQGIASLRLYAWLKATLSLGYFQSEKLRHLDPRLAQLPFVRRPSGGDTLVHHHELTYTLALPAGPPWQDKNEKPSARLTWMHTIIAAALQEFEIITKLAMDTGEERFTGILCFQHVAPGDLILGTAKIVGSAQRRYRGALLQHGGVLLARSPHTPDLPGIQNLTGKNVTIPNLARAIRSHFSQITKWILQPDPWTKEEMERIHSLVQSKYTQARWNCKR
jgi:lipoyl(octanoyl) transferase